MHLLLTRGNMYQNWTLTSAALSFIHGGRLSQGELSWCTSDCNERLLKHRLYSTSKEHFLSETEQLQGVHCQVPGHPFQMPRSGVSAQPEALKDCECAPVSMHKSQEFSAKYRLLPQC